MNVFDFAKYVVDNMGRASIANALNICNKLEVEGGYSLIEFIDGIDSYANTVYSSNKISRLRFCKIICASEKCKKLYNDMDKFKYQLRMIIDTYILDLWEACNCEH